MTHTALGLFRNPIDAEKTIMELRAAGFGAGDLRVSAEPRYMPVSSPLSTPGMDFCEELSLNLRAMGVPEPQTQAYIQGVRDGGTLVFANGSPEQVKQAAEVMDRFNTATTKELESLEPVFAEVPHDTATRCETGSAQAGRVRYAGSGARMFAW